MLGFVPWNLYSLDSLIAIAGLTHVPHVYLYSAAALARPEHRPRGSRARLRRQSVPVAINVSLPMILPAILFAGVLVFFLGFELFGLPLVLGDPQDVLVLSTYLYKLTNKLGVPSYQLMAVVVVVIIAVTAPLVFMQRLLLRQAQRYVSVRGKGLKTQPLRLHGWRWFAFAAIVFWLVHHRGGAAVRHHAALVRGDLGRRREAAPTCSRSITIASCSTTRTSFAASSTRFGIGVIGGAVAVACYTAIALAVHRWNSGWTRLVDYMVMVPRAMPGLVAGLALLWVFLFVPFLSPLKSTMVSIWLAYTIVWLAYGMRLVSGTLLQVGAGTGGSRAHRRRQRPAREARRHRAADQIRHAGELAADLPDLRARIFHRHLSARAPAPR